MPVIQPAIFVQGGGSDDGVSYGPFFLYRNTYNTTTGVAVTGDDRMSGSGSAVTAYGSMGFNSTPLYKQSGDHCAAQIAILKTYNTSGTSTYRLSKTFTEGVSVSFSRGGGSPAENVYPCYPGTGTYEGTFLVGYGENTGGVSQISYLPYSGTNFIDNTIKGKLEITSYSGSSKPISVAATFVPSETKTVSVYSASDPSTRNLYPTLIPFMVRKTA